MLSFTLVGPGLGFTSPRAAAETGTAPKTSTAAATTTTTSSPTMFTSMAPAPIESKPVASEPVVTIEPNYSFNAIPEPYKLPYTFSPQPVPPPEPLPIPAPPTFEVKAPPVALPPVYPPPAPVSPPVPSPVAVEQPTAGTRQEPSAMAPMPVAVGLSKRGKWAIGIGLLLVTIGAAAAARHHRAH